MNKFRIFFYTTLAVILAGALYFRSNTGMIYAQIGNYYYQHNNGKEAQTFFEKSFSQGYNDADIREIYVNSIINSPLTVESQEKLVNIAEDSILDAASVKAKYFLYDLRREVHRNYPLNYIRQAPFNQKIVRWSKLPITYCFVNSQNAPKEYVQEIKNAFNTWEKTSPIMFAETNKNANIVIDFKQNNAENLEYGRKYVVAYTTPEINSNTLERMNIKFYTKAPDGNDFTPNQIYNTALHEIFHALGFMGHSYDSGNIMYLAKDNQTLVEDSRLSLTEADVSTLKLLYKIKPDITNKGDLPSEYVPYLVLGDDEDISISKAREAKHYIYQAPTLPGGYIDLAESFVAQKKYPEAIKALEKALSLADTNDVKYIVYYNLAVSYYYIDHAEMALDYLNSAREIKDAEELHLLAAEIYAKKDVNKAIAEYKMLIKANPDNQAYVTNLANIYVKQHDYLNARNILKTYLKRHPEAKSKLTAYGILTY